jgi:hypothetical protein
MTTEKNWFTELFAYTVLRDGVEQSSSKVLRQILSGDGSHFDVDCSRLVSMFNSMKPIINVLSKDARAILNQGVIDHKKLLATVGNKRLDYIMPNFRIDGYANPIRIKFMKYGDTISIYVYLGNYESNFLRFSYVDNKFYWLLDVNWFKMWAEQETDKIITALEKEHIGDVVKQTGAFDPAVVKDDKAIQVIEDAIIIEKSTPVKDVVSQKPSIDDVQSMVKALQAAGEKVWFWVGVNKLKYDDPDYDAGWEQVGGSPVTSEQTAIDFAEEHQGSVFISTKKKDLWGNVVARGKYYDYIPF